MRRLVVHGFDMDFGPRDFVVCYTKYSYIETVRGWLFVLLRNLFVVYRRLHSHWVLGIVAGDTFPNHNTNSIAHFAVFLLVYRASEQTAQATSIVSKRRIL